MSAIRGCCVLHPADTSNVCYLVNAFASVFTGFAFSNLRSRCNLRGGFLAMFSNAKGIYRLFLLAGVVVFTAFVVQAQSGRRQPRSTPAAPIPTPTPEPTPTPKRENDEPGISFLVGMDRRDAFASYPFTFYDAVLRGCSDRLRASSSAKVSVIGELSRGEALKKAKEESTAYIVLLQLTQQSMGSASSNNYDQLEIEYVVFAPVTAKIAASGRSYPNSNRKGPLIIGPSGRGTNNAIYAEQLLRYAGEDAADRILKSMHLTTRGTTNLSSLLSVYSQPDVTVSQLPLFSSAARYS
jgi:hypothetical protein